MIVLVYSSPAQIFMKKTKKKMGVFKSVLFAINDLLVSSPLFKIRGNALEFLN